MDKITLLGVGNTIMQDDGFGVHVIEKMQKMKFPDNVQILDGGTLGMELLPYLEGTDKLIIVDAINAKGEIGEFFTFIGDEITRYFTNKLSIHDVGLNDLLAALIFTDKPIKETVVMGVKPAVVALGVDMTEVIADKIDYGVEKVLQQLNKWDIVPIK